MKKAILIIVLLVIASFTAELPNSELEVPCTALIGMYKATSAISVAENNPFSDTVSIDTSGCIK